MTDLLDSLLAFNLVIGAIAAVSLVVCGSLCRQWLTAERAFWGAWLFLIGSTEVVTSIDALDYPYLITADIRRYTVQYLAASAAGFILTSILLRRHLERVGTDQAWFDPADWDFLSERWRLRLSLLFFAAGAVEFSTNYSRYDNLLDLRVSSISGMSADYQVYTYLFYFAYAYLLLSGFIDGNRAARPRASVYLAMLGLVFHNLSVGGRINTVVAPLMYFTSYLLCMARQVGDALQRGEALRHFSKVLLAFFGLFALLGRLRTASVDVTAMLSGKGILKFVFAVPTYISDAYLSIGVHAGHALQAAPLYGKQTFDAAYRLLMPLGWVDPMPANLFGHQFYQDSPDPWGWTQTNVIPRLLVDFGPDYFMLAAFLIAAAMQWCTVALPRRGFVQHTVAALAVVCTLYTLQAAMWFSAFTAIILTFSVLVWLGMRQFRRRAHRRALLEG